MYKHSGDHLFINTIIKKNQLFQNGDINVHSSD